MKYHKPTIWQRLYNKLLSARSKGEDNRRRELILNILVLGMVALSGLALVLAVIGGILHSATYSGASWLVLLFMTTIFVVIYLVSRIGFARQGAYAFVALLFLFTTYPLVVWGILLPQAVLTYALLIVIAGVLLDSRAAFRVTFIMTATMLVIKRLERLQVIHFNTIWMHQTGGYSDVIAYGITFLVIALVSWLSNREIEGSLHRARRSEKALTEERNLLEVKVRERTEAMEKAQVEKLLELQRFAEFGRFSSTLLHELTNPLTAVSLNLEQLENGTHSSLIQQARQGISYMEQYVEAARRQLRKESEIRLFDVAEEIKRVIRLLDPKAKTHRVIIREQLEPDLSIRGDSIRFNQIIANLVANAIDAYNTSERKQKVVRITGHQKGGDVEIHVEDKGMGITAKDLEHVFEPFYTTKAAQRGTGLGLTITKQIVEQDFGGLIEIESTKKTGTTFILRLPLS